MKRQNPPLQPSSDKDKKWMQIAIQQAEQAAVLSEVPVGAVLVKENAIIATGANSPIKTHDPTGHAEIITIRKAGIALGNYRLPGTTLYVTLEPCIMCMGAIILARVDRLVYGADDPKSGAAVSKYSVGRDHQLNHTIKVTGGILANECSDLLTTFFRARRK